MKVAWGIAATVAGSAFLSCAANAQEIIGPETATSTPDPAAYAAATIPSATANFDFPAPATPDSEAGPPPTHAAAAAWQDDSGWRFSVTPYVFLPAIDGQLRFNPPPVDDGAPLVSIDAEDILEALEFAFMVSADAHYNRFGLLTDVLYVDLGAQNAQVDQVIRPGGAVDIPIDVETSVDFNSWLWTLAAGYDFGNPGSISFEPFAGCRYLRSEVDLDWSFQGPLGLFPQTGSLSQTEEVWDGIAGVRGQFGGERGWKLTYYGDVGAGDSEFTWQVIGGVGYAFGWGDLRFAWRHISYEQDEEKLLQDLSLSGPAFGATFRF